MDQRRSQTGSAAAIGPAPASVRPPPDRDSRRPVV